MSEPTEERPKRTCDQCGQTDDHPMVLVNPDQPSERLVHYDCMPHSMREGKVKEWANKAEGGTKGMDLHKVIMPHEYKKKVG